MVGVWELLATAVLNAGGVVVSGSRLVGGGEIVVVGEDQSPVVEGDRPPMYWRPFVPYLNGIGDAVGIVLDHCAGADFTVIVAGIVRGDLYPGTHGGQVTGFVVFVGHGLILADRALWGGWVHVRVGEATEPRGQCRFGGRARR